MIRSMRKCVHGVYERSSEAIYPVKFLYKSIAGRYRPVRVADGPIMARYRFIKNTSWVVSSWMLLYTVMHCFLHYTITLQSQMRRLIWVFAVRIYPEDTLFPRCSSIVFFFFFLFFCFFFVDQSAVFSASKFSRRQTLFSRKWKSFYMETLCMI